MTCGIAAVERAILESQGEMDWKISHLTALVQCLVGNKHFVPLLQMEDEEEDCVFPLMSMEDLDCLEQRLNGQRDNAKICKIRCNYAAKEVTKMTNFGRAFMHNLYLISVLGEQIVWQWRSNYEKDHMENLHHSFFFQCGQTAQLVWMGDKRGIRKTNIGALIIGTVCPIAMLQLHTYAESGLSVLVQ